MSTTTKRAQYRQRVYQFQDMQIILVFGEDLAPAGGKLVADHDVTELVTVTDHVEIKPAPPTITLEEHHD